jgi:hypothetical protein
MTNKFANWERLQRVIEWANMSTNYFALHIGLSRGENLYNIKKGNYGISNDLANRIVSHFPEIDHTWLLTGIGNMLKSQGTNGDSTPYYNGRMEDILPALDKHTPSGQIYTPYTNGCDLVARSMSRAMNETQCAATDLFLKRVDCDDIVQGNEYVLIINKEVIWRKVRLASEENRFRLVARNREEWEDIFVERDRISQAWRVIARLAIMSS